MIGYNLFIEMNISIFHLKIGVVISIAFTQDANFSIQRNMHY